MYARANLIRRSVVPPITNLSRNGSLAVRNHSTISSGGSNDSSNTRNFSTGAAEPFLNGSSSAYVEEMYNSWLQDPKTVHAVSFLCFSFNYNFVLEIRRIIATG